LTDQKVTVTEEEARAQYAALYEAVGFHPLPKQQLLLDSLARYNIFVGGIGAGKSKTAAQYAWPRMVMPNELPGGGPARYWIVGQNYAIPHMEFEYVKQAFADFGIPTDRPNMPSEGSWKMEIPGVSVIETKSWTNPESLHSVPVHGMLICEAGLLDPWVWHERLRPRLARVPNSWVLLSGTLEDTGPFFKDLVRDVVIEDSVEGWYGVSMATWENTAVYPGGMEHEEIQELRATTPPDIFLERYGAVPKSVAALVYKEFTHRYHVGKFKFDKHRPVTLWVDPGGVYAINAVQRHGRDVYIIDEIHLVDGNSEWAIEETTSKRWWKKVEAVIIDATQKEAEAAWSGGHVWRVLGKQPVPVHYQKVPVEPGIELVRTKLHSGVYDEDEGEVWEFQGRPGVARLHVDAKCEHTIYEFAEGYKRRKVRSGEYSDTEVVKRNDHHMDAIRYGLADMFGFQGELATAGVSQSRRQWVDSRPRTPWRGGHYAPGRRAYQRV